MRCRQIRLKKGCVRAMHKIGIIGDKDSVMGFSALGLSVRYCENASEAKEALREMEDYGIIYITENLFAQISELHAAYRDRVTPALVPIPGNRGSLGLGMARVKSNIERAVGADIIGESE